MSFDLKALLSDPVRLKAFLQELAVKHDADIRAGGDGPEVDTIRRTFGISIKADSLNEKDRSVRVIASTDAIDSYDEIVDQDWRLDRYKANPVVLYGHNRVGFLGMGGDPNWTLPIGFATDITAKGQLEATLNFVDERANPMAVKVWEGFRQTSIRAVSVGFKPHTIKAEKIDDKEIYRLSDNELFEISPVPIPANPEAVALSAERQNERAWLRSRAYSIPAARAAQEKSTMELEALKAELKAATEARNAAEAALKSKTGELTSKDSELTSLKSELTASKAKVTELEGKIAALETQLKAIETEKTDKAIDAEVQALVGKKLTPEQKADFVALRKSNPEQFQSIVKGLPDQPEVSDATIKSDVEAIVAKKIAPAQKDAFIKLRTQNPELFAEIVKGLPDMPHGKNITGHDPNQHKNFAKPGSGTSTINKNAKAAADKARAEA